MRKTGALQARVTLRPKGQITLPQQIVRKLNVKTGDALIITVEDDHPERIEIRPIRFSYAGVANGIYGAPEEARAYVEHERDSWDE